MIYKNALATNTTSRTRLVTVVLPLSVPSATPMMNAGLMAVAVMDKDKKVTRDTGKSTQNAIQACRSIPSKISFQFKRTKIAQEWY